MADARFWNKIAKKYARQPISDEAGYQETLSRTGAHMQSTDRLLEIGCGTGNTARTLSLHCVGTVGTDISPAMIAVAEERAAAEPGHNLTFRVAVAEDVQPEAPFDVICAFNILHLVDNLPTALAALHRQMKPGGKLISKTPCIGEANLLIRMIIPVMQLLGKAPPVLSLRLGELRRDLTAAGFRELEHKDFGGRTGWHFLVVEKI